MMMMVFLTYRLTPTPVVPFTFFFQLKQVGMQQGQQQQQESSLHFLCRITQLPPSTTTDTQSDQVRISFTLVKGKSSTHDAILCIVS